MQKPLLTAVLALLAVYLVSHWVQSTLGLGYPLFQEAFSLAKSGLDFGIWLLVFVVSYVAIDALMLRFTREKKSEGTASSSWTQILMEKVDREALDQSEGDKPEDHDGRNSE